MYPDDRVLADEAQWRALHERAAPNPDDITAVQTMSDRELMEALEEAVAVGADVQRNDDPDRLVVVTTRLPQSMIAALKERATAAGIPYQRLPPGAARGWAAR